MTNRQAPSAAELEVSLFGPGYGESILIHAGDNIWILIDSCIDKASSKPAPISYLESIGVDPSSAIHLIIATHWHDDHIRGISQVLDICKEAEFCCSMALSKDEFISNVTKHEVDNTISGGSGAREIVNVLKILRGKSPKRAIAGMLLKRFDLSHKSDVEVWALSPSDKQIDQFLADIASICPSIAQTRFRLTSENKNNTSLVLWVKAGDTKILLGGDLEETPDEDTGWTVVLKSEGRGDDKAEIFKIPHHGSVTAYSHDVWTHMLSETATAILTPFYRGKSKLPSKEDARRILDHTNDAYISANKFVKAIKTRPKIVDKMIKQTVRDIRPVQMSPGIVTLRKKIDSQNKWDIFLENGACHLSEILK